MRGMLKLLLRKEPVYCAVVNRYADPEATNFLISGRYQKLPNLPIDCYISGDCSLPAPFPPSPQTRDKLLYYYVMDISSLLPVLALSPETDHSVLDTCSAPGGKAFALLQFLLLKGVRDGGVALNDISYGRLKRLKTVIAKCLPKELRHSVRFTQRRAEDWAKIEPNSYDRVLVDVPCSSDRHNAGEWTRKGIAYPNTKQFSDLQQRVLLAALHATRSGGMVAYSTCTLSETENDKVVSNTLIKANEDGIDVEIMPTQDACLSLLSKCCWTRTETGLLVTPTEAHNCGPTFTSVMLKC